MTMESVGMKLRQQTVALLAAALTLAAILGCGQKTETVQTEQTLTVLVEPVQSTSLQITRTYTGSAEGLRQANIYAKAAEAVSEVHVHEGSTVKQGQVLISLDKSGPSSSYRSAESVYRNAEKTYGKMELLVKEGAVSEAQFDAARTEYEVSKAAFEAAASLVEIQSPIDGLVTALEIAPGDYLSQGEVLATVASIDSLRVKFKVNDRDIGLIQVGGEVRITSEAVSSTAAGRVLSVAKSADPATRAFEVEAVFANPEGVFRPGMFVRVVSVVSDLTDVIAIPRSAVISLADQMTVFVVSGGCAQRRVVQLGAEVDGRVVVSSGLSAGDSLVTLGQNYLKVGAPVRAANAESIRP